MTPDQINTLAREADTFERISDFLGWLNIAFVIATAIVTIATFYSSNRLSKAKEKIAELKIADANAKAAKANEGAANANEQARKAVETTEKYKAKQVELAIEVSEAKTRQAVAEEKQAIAQRSLLEVQRRLAPRNLTDTQKEALTGLLNAGRKGSVLVVHAMGDSEAAAYAVELADILKRVGWKVEGPDPMMNPVIPKRFTEKILISINKKNENLPEVISLLKAFEQAGIPAGRVLEERGLDNFLEIYIGNKL